MNELTLETFRNRSIATGLTHELSLSVTAQQAKLLHQFLRDRSGLPHIQDIIPQATPSEREFFISGTTQEEWEELFGLEQHNPDQANVIRIKF
jgi:hypothetical protein